MAKHSFFYHNFWGLNFAAFVLLLHGVPGKSLPSSHWMELISLDKLIHASLFFALNILVIEGFQKQNNFEKLSRYAFACATIFCVAYGGLLEVMQGAIFDHRSPDIYDLIADSAGSLLAIGLYDKVIQKFKTLDKLEI